MSFTLQQSSFLSPLLGDQEIIELFSVEADLAAMIRFEVTLAKLQAKAGLISDEAAEKIALGVPQFKPDIEKIQRGIARDGISVPVFIQQLKEQVNTFVHFGATSQDAIDTSFMLRSQSAISILVARVENLIARLDQLTTAFGKNKLMARTRMQAALQFTVADRLANWRSGLLDAIVGLKSCRFAVQYGGPIGTLHEFPENGDALRSELASALGLEAWPQNWQSNRSSIVAIANACSLVTGSIGKLGADYCLMAQDDLAEVKFKGGGTSSVMQHKQNPIQAEALVTLARFNATLISGVHQSLVHEQERSGAAWTLEWMLLPQMIVAAGAATRTAKELLQSTIAIGHA